MITKVLDVIRSLDYIHAGPFPLDKRISRRLFDYTYT